MAVSSSWLRACAAAVLAVGLLGLGSGCKSKSNGGTAADLRKIEGTITYDRIPLHIGSDGKPTGLDTDASKVTNLPARGVQVRLFQARDQVAIDGSTATAWLQVGTAVTDVNGHYALNSITPGYLTFLEVVSMTTGTGSSVKIVADPAGIDSTVPEPSRLIYSLRKGIDGSTSTTNPTPGVLLEADATVNFNVGLKDTWLTTPSSWNQPATGPFTYPATVAAGSRVLAIMDSIYTFQNIYGDPTPGSLDLHYRPGVRHPRGSFVEYDPTVYPHSFNGGSLVYSGSLAGDSVSDDAFLEGVIFPLLARNNLFAQLRQGLLPVSAALTNLSPDMAVIEGLADAMACTLLKSPYLPDTTLAARYPPIDVRSCKSLPLAQQSVFSAPTVRGLAWEITLTANSLASPGVPADWANITPANTLRFFRLSQPTMTSGTATVVSDTNSLLQQVGRLQETIASGEALNLAAFFSDTVLTPLLAGFNLSWPTTSNLPKYTSNWGQDPDSLVAGLAPLNFTMANAALVRGVYPNASNGEVARAMFSLTKDRGYDLVISAVPALAPGATLEVLVDNGASGTFLLGGSNPSSTRLVLRGNFADLTLPTWHRMQFRLLSPATVQPDTQITVHLNKTN